MAQRGSHPLNAKLERKRSFTLPRAFDRMKATVCPLAAQVDERGGALASSRMSWTVQSQTGAFSLHQRSTWAKSNMVNCWPVAFLRAMKANAT